MLYQSLDYQSESASRRYYPVGLMWRSVQQLLTWSIQSLADWRPDCQWNYSAELEMPQQWTQQLQTLKLLAPHWTRWLRPRNPDKSYHLVIW